MDVVNPALENDKLLETTTSDAVAEDAITSSPSEISATGNSNSLTSKSTSDVDVIEGHRDKVLATPSLSIDVDKTLKQVDDEPPIIVRVPDLSTAPSLRGRMLVEGNMHKCQGVWAMNDSSHSIPGQTSDFELRLAFSGAPPQDIPVDGRYSGWFMIKHPQKNTSSKIEDKDLDMKFTKKENSNDYDVAGVGVNKFGKFTVQGTLKSNKMIQLYKIYQPKRAAGGATPRSSVGASPRPRGATPHGRPSSTPSAAAVSSPRESSSRVRRPSLAMAESLAPAPEKTTSAAKPVSHRSSSKQAQKSSLPVESAASSRASRPPPFVNKCKDVLKDMMKQVSAIYFADAVDHVKLGIPDYPTIVKEPMDFGTIRLHLDNQVYKGHEMFAEHMRLVFKNAIMYNVRRDNPVHIAARELSDMFEERYRVMVSQLGASAYAAEVEAPVALTRQPSAAGSRKSGGGRGRGRTSHGGSGAGPRALEATAPVDSSAQQIMLMHQKMLDMEQELQSLRTAVRQTEIRTSLDQQRVAAQIPLSYDEKKALIENIQRLDGDQITAVVDIIQSAMPSTDCGGEGDEVEIPMDELDTYTLRQLQDYVHSIQKQAINAKRKRQSMASSSVAVRTPRGKKARGSSASQKVPSPPVQDVPSPSVEQEEQYPVHGRKRSNSLDLFPSQEMEQDPVLATNPDGNMGLDAWTAPPATSNGGGGHSSSEAGGSWGVAVSERQESLHRESEMKADADKLSAHRAKVESDRQTALKRAYEEQASLAGKDDTELLSQRDQERARRAEMTQTVELDQSHDALYQESFDL